MTGEAQFCLRRELVEQLEQDLERARRGLRRLAMSGISHPGLCEFAMYGVSHSAPNEYRETVRTDGARRDIVPGNPGFDARATVGDVATHEPIAVAFATGGGGEHRGAQVDARARLLESSDQRPPELRHDVFPRQPEHAEQVGEVDVAYAARKQALALDQQFHGDAFCIDHFAKLERAVGAVQRILLSRGAIHASPHRRRPARLVERLSGMVGGSTRGSIALIVDRVVYYDVLDESVKYIYAR